MFASSMIYVQPDMEVTTGIAVNLGVKDIVNLT
jgi:hypothetical protein